MKEKTSSAPTETLHQKLARLRGVEEPDMGLSVGVAVTGSTVYITYHGVELVLPFDTAVDDLLAELTGVRTSFSQTGEES